MKRLLPALVLLLSASSAWSQWSGRLTALGGAVTFPGAKTADLERFRFEGKWQGSPSPDWRFEASVLGAWTNVGDPYVPADTLDGEGNILRANGSKLSDDGRSLWSGRLQTALASFETGRWEIQAGRWRADWGESKSVQPTRVFHAPRLLEAFGDPPVGSDGADASFALGPNTNLEGAFRVMDGAKAEGVLRLENKGIGVAFTPLYAHRTRENGLGTELSATLKKFQWRLEGVAWQDEGSGVNRVEGATGLSTVLGEFPLHLEFLRDGAGRLLGEGATDASRAAGYAVLSLETPHFYRWRVSPLVAKSFEGGKWMAKPGLQWEIAGHYLAEAGGMVFWGDGPGPLSNVPSRLWISLSMTF